MYKGYFTEKELACRHCGKHAMDPKFMEMVVELRERLKFPFHVSSAYRCPEHPTEASKKATGAHTTGTAMDVLVSGSRAYKMLREALAMGFLGVGVKQKGDVGSRFIHIDMWENPEVRPAIWSY